MSLGSVARKLLGPRLFNVVGDRYRAFFVDLNAVVDSLPALRPGARVLDIGGGDGALINLLVAKFPGVQVTMIDLSATIGAALQENVRPSVELLPGTSARAYAAQGRPTPDMVLVSDVIHHVPKPDRAQFLEDVFGLAAEGTTVVLKDVQPGSWRAHLAFLADRYISGDRNVEFITQQELETLASTISGRRAKSTSLIERDSINYCLIFSETTPRPLTA